MSKKSTTQLSMDYLNKSGFVCERVEHWNAFAKRKHDLFNFADIIAYKTGDGEDEGTIALVQTTSEDNFSARKKKIYASPHYQGWKMAGGFIVVHGWGKNGLREEWL